MAVIKNSKELGQTPARKDILAIAEAGFAAIDTEEVIRRAVSLSGDTLAVSGEQFLLTPSGRLIVVGIGKCSLKAACALEKMLDGRVSAGIVLDVGKGEGTRKLRYFKGDHPYPTEENKDATTAILELLKGLTAADTVIFIISGGGTVLLCQPENHTCQQEKEIVQALFKAGANITDMNAIRKHLSLARGGFLAKAAYPAQVVSLLFSDVPGNSIETIASGPTVRDTTTVADAVRVAERYGLLNVPSFDTRFLIETPKEEKYFERVRNILVVSNMTALQAMAAKAKELGYRATVATDTLSGEAREAGKFVIGELAKLPPKSAALFGGETTVTITGAGTGGRNQELALSALVGLGEGEAVASFASDGVDNGPPAGALCDTMIQTNATKLGLDPMKFLAENDSFHFFEKTGGHIITGQTGSNVSDLVIALKT